MESRIELYKRFLEEFPIESLREMPIEKYTNLNRSDSFCYWVESQTFALGSIWGGSSYKFGIYKYIRKPNEKDPRIVSDNAYAWYAKYDKATAAEAYGIVRDAIAEIAEAARKGELERIDGNYILGEGIKWKIAFLYSNLSLVPIYKKEMLDIVAKEMGMEDAGKRSIPDIQRYLMSKKDESQELFDYYDGMLAFLNNSTSVISKDLFDEIRTRIAEDERFIAKNSRRDFLWIGTKDGVIGNSKCHYEVIYRKNKKANDGANYAYVEIHFEDNDAPKFKSVADLPGLEEFKWSKLGIRAIESGISTVGTNAQDLAEALVEQLRNLDDIAGPAISKILGNSEKNKNMGAKYIEYIKLLKASRNLILTGAPGTGKTYLAKAIAEEMSAVTDFVQFHPSYDYTDFVEGLRPSGDGTFERRDGIFKEFCKAALKNLEDSKKTQKGLAEEKDIDERIERFLSAAIESQTLMELKTGNKFTITEYTDKVIRVESKDNEKTPRIDIRMSEVRELLEKNIQLDNVHDIRNHFGRKFGTQQDSYTFVITCAIKATKAISVAPINKVERKDFVFIIDEINRGEMSKILGELFFSIDPGYRGKKGCVKTQYQNLIDDDDVFAKGFFIPENVYIIGTMNDIDRSVESMDFAVRRRFTWKEVLPESRMEMWDDCSGSWKADAAEKMSRLNATISDGSVGLSREYSIGPAYFRNLDNYNGDFDKLWEMHLEPLLREYLRGSRNIEESIKKLKNAYNLVDEPQQNDLDF